MDPLPIDALIPAIAESLAKRPSLVLLAPPGAGKTTRVPPALVDRGVVKQQRVVVLEPRRLAARSAAKRMADERGGRVGDEVGYAVRFDRAYGPKTRILVVTEGVFLRMLQDDPFLEDVGAVVFDEFHERSLNLDLALALSKKVQAEARPDLKLAVMSATLQPGPVAAYLDECPTISVEGRTFPLSIEYLPLLSQMDGRAVPSALRRGVLMALEQTTGDVLAFLPGVGEIRRTAEELADEAERRGIHLFELYGDLTPDQQDAALRRCDRRKVVLATNVAETSVTVEGVTAVVDSGLARVMTHDPSVGIDRLELTRISQASADQRAGRAGRTGPGICIRLWAEQDHRRLPLRTEPEIRRADLAGTVLELRCWGERDLDSFPWLEPPARGAMERAQDLLRRLGALDAKLDVTEVGRSMVRLPVHPRLARLMVEGHRLGIPDRASLTATMLSERDPYLRSPERRSASHVSESDVVDRVSALEAFAAKSGPMRGELNVGAARFILHAAEQSDRMLRQELGRPPRLELDADDALRRAVFAAFPDRLCKRREPKGRRGLMVGGRGVRLDDASAVADADLFIAVDVAGGGAEELVRQASAVDRRWLPPQLLHVDEETRFDAATKRVVATRRTRWLDLPIEEATFAPTDDEAAAKTLAEAASADFVGALPLDEPAVGGFLTRVRCLREWMPELDLPAFDDDFLRSLLPALCAGRKSFAELKKAPLLDFLRGELTLVQQRALDREAPERFTVPSGSSIALAYAVGRPPVLAVRIQELFGLPETPTLAAGRISVLLHLLAPNNRPQQVTQDLRNFWNTTYTQVRKDLRARYPKHAWPEDPWNAPPEARPRRKK